MDREHRKHHALINKRITADMIEPPIFVAVVGPPNVSKSLLIRSLIKHYTTTKITDCRGPMTILANSTRRITFLECPNDLNAMIDVAKTCDLVSLLVDASYGFEMETFEFLNCAQVHGFPRVMGVLTHLDKYVKLKKKQSIVYHVKHRFWKEIYAGAKLFVLKGIDKKTDYYYKSDIQNLVRFISVLKFRPIKWRNNHSYILADRYEDLTEPSLIHKYGEKHVNRSIAFYGYIRGCNLRNKQNVHICGVGDFEIKSIEEMEDPVPTKQTKNKSNTLRVLTKNGKVYAPMANLGPVVFDKHAAYITVRSDAESAKRYDLKKHTWETEEAYIKRLKAEAMKVDESKKLIDIKSGDAKTIMHKLRDRYIGESIDKKMEKSKLKLFADSEALSSKDINEFEINRKVKEIENKQNEKGNRVRRRVRFEDEIKENEMEIESDSDVNMNENNFDFNKDIMNENKNENDVQMFVNESDGNKRDFWSDVWLDSEKEKERKHIEMNKRRIKMEKQKKLKRGISVNESESNVRWKQNLLSNASEIWSKQINLSEYIYGKDINENKNNNNNANDSDSDDEFFKIKTPMSINYGEIDTVDSAVCVLDKFNINNSNVNDWWDMNNENIRETLRNRFVTGDWVEAKKFESEVEKRAFNVNPEMYDKGIQKDREILEELGAKTEDNEGNEFMEETLDWEYKLEKLMKEKGIGGDITMDDKLSFVQNGLFSKNDINNSENKNENNESEIRSDRYNISTMDLEDLARLEAKIKKKQQFDREFDNGLLEFDSAFDKTGVSKEEQNKIFEKKGNWNKENNKRDRRGKLRGRGGLGMDDRKNLPGSGKGVYYMDIIREEMAQQNEINKNEFINEKKEFQNELQGYIPGSYVRVIIENIPPEFDINFDLEYPIIIGGLLSQEMQFGLVQCRIKKHRWYKRLLKFNDPLIISCGWRRFQTCPIYCMEDRNSSIKNKRLRMIKYTPENMHCLAVFYGPIVSSNNGILGYISSSQQINGFRISAIGNILSSNLSYKIVKKLKLVGEAMEIHKNTCFVKGMFNTNIEVSKFIGGKLQTVSGIRGSIKKANGVKGNFRATFEDKLLKSDIIFLKTFIPISPIEFYYNVKNLLLINKQLWNGMKTQGQIKFEKQLKLNHIKPKNDSVYNKVNDIKRNPLRKFNKLVVPKKLENNLPYRLRPKYNRDLQTKKEKHLQQQNYATNDEKKIQKFITNISLIAVNHNERELEMKRKKRKRKNAFKKDKLKQDRLKKRQRIQKHLTNDHSNDVNLQFEATRGNKFHKEWRLQKK